jgi:hypothetical protein
MNVIFEGAAFYTSWPIWVKIGVECRLVMPLINCNQLTIGAVKALFKGINDFAGVFYTLCPNLAKKMSVEKILCVTLTSLCEQGNRPVLRTVSLHRLQPRVFVIATVSSPKWKKTLQFLQFHFFLSTCDSYLNGSTHCQDAYLRARVQILCCAWTQTQ